MNVIASHEKATNGRGLRPSLLWRVILPLAIALTVLIATVCVSGSVLNTIEDITVNRVLAGTYGTPDWRVQEMNPLLAQLLTLLYRIVPAVNWYGALLLALLLASATAAMSLAARKKGGLLPVAVILCPIILLLANSVHSTAVCALCAATGSLWIMDSLPRWKSESKQVIGGAVLFLFAAMLSLYWALLLTAAAAVCYLPGSLREARGKGFPLGVALMAVLSLALYGYTALLYNTPEMAAYRSHYALYQRLQHSSLNEESDSLLSTYGMTYHVNAYEEENHGDHDHGDDDAAHGHDDEGHAAELPDTSFDVVNWTLNDASLFFIRNASDAELTDPETLQILSGAAHFVNASPGRLLSELFITLKKPQFLLLIALLALTALGVVITSRNKGLVALLAVLFALGGHIGTLACYYSAFADIAPFYLLAILALVYHFDGEDAKAWVHKVLAGRVLRIGVSSLALVFFAAGMAGFLYYASNASPNNPYTAEAVAFIKPYMASHPDVLFIGDNPNDRQKPPTLAAPARGEDQNLLAGSYDLYSPRSAALMEKFGLTNPLKDSLDREDIAYILMSYSDIAISLRLAEAYDLYAKPPENVLTQPYFSERIIRLSAYSPEEVEERMEQARNEQEQMELWAEFFQHLDEMGLLEEWEEGEPAADAAPVPEPPAGEPAEPAPDGQ